VLWREKIIHEKWSQKIRGLNIWLTEIRGENNISKMIKIVIRFSVFEGPQTKIRNYQA